MKLFRGLRRSVIAFVICVIVMLNETGVLAACPIAEQQYRVHHAPKYLGVEKLDGIDVSEHQGDIDWAKVKKAGIQFAFIRIGGRGWGSSGNMYFDSNFVQNVKGALANGIQVGLYFYSQALTVTEARDEAQRVLTYMRPQKGTDLYNQLKGGIWEYKDKITLPIVMDYEYSPSPYGRFVAGTISREQATRNAEAFIGEIKAAGFDACVYGSACFLEDQLDVNKLYNTSSIWLAHFTDYTDYEGEYTWWQYSERGHVDGISENVDMDVWYKKEKIDTEYHCVKTTYNGETGWYCVRGGKVVPNFTGFVENENGWWYIVNGKVDFNHTGVYKGTLGNTEGWWNVKGSKVSFGSGFAQNENGWWYIINGKVDFSVSGVIKGTVNGQNGWWTVRGGKVYFDNTVAKNENGWWYCKQGKVDFSYTGIAKNQYGWWRIEGGKVNFNSNTIAKNENGWWYLKNGKVDFSFNGIAQNENGYWVCRGGKVDFSFTGLAKGTYGWWYCRGGRVDFNYKGIVENQYGKWYVLDGKVMFDYYGYLTINGSQYYIRGGKVVE
ncbi:MAG: glycoside hydrolase family 25 protein [Eubacterium sp.]|nr:glycoside hydrolase family 25 protein [Eubacterium sp.]